MMKAAEPLSTSSLQVFFCYCFSEIIMLYIVVDWNSAELLKWEQYLK